MPRDRQEHRKWELKRAWIKSKKVQGNCVQQRLLERYVGFHQTEKRKEVFQATGRSMDNFERH